MEGGRVEAAPIMDNRACHTDGLVKRMEIKCIFVCVSHRNREIMSVCVCVNPFP